MKKISEQITDALKSDMNRIAKVLSFVIEHKDAIDAIGHDSTNAYGFGIDFDRMSHDKIMQLVQLFPGKWEKRLNSANADRIDYVLRFPDGLTVRAWAGEPPPSCQIVEVEKDVPAVPAGKRKVRKVVCKDEEVVAV